ncbi:3-dehydrosphinganine reductase [Coemansia javaensis]|uniref:3-dehydrosphinganine reductase n=1 Tax=Coemansia javaensis TaxID=2761396 RepID=A0A9W8H659_9FUNG|nr:3-dehydrosphinganine reductase [Coemansia javaensis]
MEGWVAALTAVFSVIGGVAVLGLAAEVAGRALAPKLEVRGKHCYVTGGSQGLGKSVAQELARRGAHVTIVARREAILKEAVEEIKACVPAEGGKGQRIEYVVADVTDSKDAVRAVEEAVAKQQGLPVSQLFTVAGAANPGVFVEQGTDLIRKTMELNYLGTMYTVHEVARRMVEGKVRGGRVVMVSSVLGMLGLVGYAAYCPSKYAVRGLAEALRNELQMHGISVHCYFPGTIFTPGYDAENLTKPQITKDIEGADDGLTPEKCAEGLFRGLQRGEFAIATDPIGLLLRCSARGVAPNNNVVLDALIAPVGWAVFGVWRLFIDRTVRNHGKKAKTE